MNLRSLAVVLLVGIPCLVYLATAAVLLLNRAPGHDLPLLPWWPSWDPDAYDDIGKRWLPWHKRATALLPVGIMSLIVLLLLPR